MHNKKRILELFDKLLLKQITSQEKEELFHLTNNDKNKNIVFGWLKEHWDTTEYKLLNLESKSILNKIHQQAKINDTSTLLDSSRNLRIGKIIRTVLQYAAVITITLAIQWFVQLKNTEPGTMLTTQSNIYNEITVPAGSKSLVILADSTKVWLNAGAKLRYPSSFDQGSRNVYLEGEAFFDVTKNVEAPFFVNMKGMDIKVLGTQFNVKAYGDEDQIETTLIEGSIEIVGLKSDKDNEKNLLLEPGQKLILYKDTKQHTIESSMLENPQKIKRQNFKIKQAEVVTLLDLEPEVSWKEDKLIFQKERFENVKIKLERWYGVNIEVKDKEILDYRFTGTFDKETFEQALIALKEAANFNYNIKKKQVVIRKN